MQKGIQEQSEVTSNKDQWKPEGSVMTYSNYLKEKENKKERKKVAKQEFYIKPCSKLRKQDISR